MGRINRRIEIALKAATEVLVTTKNHTVKARMIKTILNYEMHQQKRAETNKITRRKHTQKKELDGLYLKISELTKELGLAETSKADIATNLSTELHEKERLVTQLQSNLANAKEETETARGNAGDTQEQLKLTKRMIGELALALPEENRAECASKLFYELKSIAPELLAKLFKCLELKLEKWFSWDTQYEKDSESMVEAFAAPEKLEPGKLSLFRAKLLFMGINVNAINAVRDYRDLKISLANLRALAGPAITFTDGALGPCPYHSLPAHLMPRLTENALRVASKQLSSDPAQKMEWLHVVQSLLKPDAGIGSLLSQEIISTRSQLPSF